MSSSTPAPLPSSHIADGRHGEVSGSDDDYYDAQDALTNADTLRVGSHALEARETQVSATLSVV